MEGERNNSKKMRKFISVGWKQELGGVSHATSLFGDTETVKVLLIKGVDELGRRRTRCTHAVPCVGLCWVPHLSALAQKMTRVLHP